MKVRLGYACLPITIDETSSRMITYTYYKKLGDKGPDKLQEVIFKNLNSLKKILHYNIVNEINFFRITSNLFPLATHPKIPVNLDDYKKELEEIGNIIKYNNMRVDLHLDPYYVLNSTKDEVVSSTINILEFYQTMFNYMKVDYKIITHVGGKAGGKREGIKRFINNFQLINPEIQKKIVVENDDKVYNIRNVLKICETLNIPMVLDYHHFICNRNNEKIEDYLIRILNTWNDIPKMHFSSPKSKKEKRAHSDYIDANSFIIFIEKLKQLNINMDIMIEAKAKDDAVFKLVRQLKYCDYKVDGTTINL